jgi:hypothetical protein
MSSKTDTKHHTIERDRDFDQSKFIPILGSLKETTRVTDKETGAQSYGAGDTQAEADQKAWDNLRSENETHKR